MAAEPLTIGILGTRGIPAAYGGFETFAEELAARLAARGHRVTVFCRSGNVDPSLDGEFYRGVRLVVLPAPRSKHLETVVHTLRSAWEARHQRFDLALVCNSANFPSLPLLRLAGSRTALAIDGIESHRRKWGAAGRTFYRLASRLGPALADVIVADCHVIENWYRARGVRDVEMIAYGASAPEVSASATETLDRLGVESGGYLLYVSRLEPENNADVVIRAYRRANIDLDLLVVGDAPYATEYRERLDALAEGHDRIRFAGYIFGHGYDELRAHAGCYVQATDVGGTHPALLEAMAAGLPIIANDIPEHREVLGETGRYYRKNDPIDLARRLGELYAAPDGAAVRDRLAAAARDRVTRMYDWEAVTSRYEDLARRLARVRDRR